MVYELELHVVKQRMELYMDDYWNRNPRFQDFSSNMGVHMNMINDFGICKLYFIKKNVPCNEKLTCLKRHIPIIKFQVVVSENTLSLS